MNTLLRTACAVFGASAALALSGTAVAQVASPKIIISNVTPNIEIPLQTSSQVQFLSNGDLSVQCRLNGSSCPSVGGGEQPGPGPVAFTLTPSSTTVNSNAAFNLTWNSSDSDACYAVAPASITNWTSSNRVYGNSGSQSISINNSTQAAVTYTFQLRCYNANGSRTATSAVVTVNPGTSNPPAGEYCAEYYGSSMPTGPNFTAHGLTKVQVPFENIWTNAIPGGTDVLKGVPGPRLTPSAAGRYLAIPFVMTEDNANNANSQFTAGWNQSQIGDTPSGSVTVTVSPCPGDFRAPSANPSDPYLSYLCRGTFGLSGSITVDANSFAAGCHAPKNKQMYINIATYNMYSPTLPATTSCGANPTCGVMMRMD